MKLSLHISTSREKESNGANDSDSNNNPDYPDINNIVHVLANELENIYPEAKNYDEAEISLTFMTSEQIRELNRTYRNTDEPTDVLSFPMYDELPKIPEMPLLSLGDIVICPEEVLRLHPDLKHNKAINLMIAHSFLHLLGFDHDNEENQAIMWAKQDEIARRMSGGKK